MRTILKFDVGASGFKKAIYLLAFLSVGLIFIGIYFIMFVLKPYD